MMLDTSGSETSSARRLSGPYEHWKLSLQEVKLLHLQRRHKQCAALAVEVLNKSDTQLHSIHRAYLHYYCAASYEMLGRATHNFSSNKIPLLRMAKDRYATCGAFLETAFITFNTEDRHGEDEWDISSDDEALDFSSSSISARSGELWTRVTDSNTSDSLRQCTLWSHSTASHPGSPWDSPTPPPPHLRWEVSQGTPSGRKDSETPIGIILGRKEGKAAPDLVPSPLLIRKSACFDIADLFPIPSRPLPEPPVSALQVNEPRPLPEPPILPLRINRRNHSPVSDSSSDPFIDSGHELGIHIYRYQANDKHAVLRLLSLLSSLNEQIDENIHTISDLIEKTTDLQRLHNATKISRFASFWSFTPNYTNGPGSPTKTAGAKTAGINGRLIDGGNLSSSCPGQETKQQRIARLKAEGWKTVGIKSPTCGWKGTQYYEELCSRALTELYQM